jgi:hypothetical protein
MRPSNVRAFPLLDPYEMDAPEPAVNDGIKSLNVSGQDNRCGFGQFGAT